MLQGLFYFLRHRVGSLASENLFYLLSPKIEPFFGLFFGFLGVVD